MQFPQITRVGNVKSWRVDILARRSARRYQCGWLHTQGRLPLALANADNYLVPGRGEQLTAVFSRVHEHDLLS